MPMTTRLRSPQCLLALMLLLAALPALGVERHALVIGNAAYRGEAPLQNTLNDARDMARLLEGLGFEIAGGGPLEDADRNTMARAVNRFLSRVRGRDGIALIYYSGHGMRDRFDANYLIPTDAVIEQEPDVRAAGIALSDILDALDQRPRGAVSLVVVDACRNNPFAVGAKGGKRGLGRVDPARGTLVLYSASPGQQADDNRAGSNGLFTKHLLAQIARPGLDVEDAFDAVSLAVERDSGGAQIPWSGGNLRGKVYLGGEADGGGTGQGAGRDYDLIAWQAAERCGKPVCYRAYLKDHPNGRFATIAKAMLEAEEPAAQPDAQAREQALGLTREERRAVQQALNTLGHAVGAADGLWGRNTRRGIAAWQRAIGREASGYLDAPGYKALLAAAAEHGPKPGDVFRDTLRDGGRGPEMVVIPAGSFQMGSNDGDDDEKPVHRVSISRAFAMGKYEVTFGEYDRFARATGRKLPDDEGWGRGQRPVINISWEDASAYAIWLSEQTGAEYRLPSEAEWEYAARAGSTTAYWWGERASHEYANYGKDACCGGLSQGRDRWVHTAPVGSFGANPFGLYDTAGNVWEWVFDWYAKDAYAKHSATDPVVRQGGSDRVGRGGSWYDTPRDLRSAYRSFWRPGIRSGGLGVRLARTL